MSAQLDRIESLLVRIVAVLENSNPAPAPLPDKQPTTAPTGEPDLNGIVWNSFYSTCKNCHENNKRWGYSVKRRKWRLYETTGFISGEVAPFHVCHNRKNPAGHIPGPVGQENPVTRH